MAKFKQLTVWLENKPGTLAAMAEALGRAKVNILAYMADEAEGQSRVRLVASKPGKAGKALAGLNLRFSEEEVVGVVLANKPGTLAEAAGKLGLAGININHGYCGSEEGSKKQLVIFGVSDLQRASKALK
ncbi:MAG: acetolactate synthase [Acidobacteriota bacterium]